MILEFIKTKEKINFEKGGYNISPTEVVIEKTDLPKVEGGFYIWIDENTRIDYSAYKTYFGETSEGYAIFSTKENKFYLYYCLDWRRPKYICNIAITTEPQNSEMFFLREEGKTISEENKKIFDEDGFYLYKVENKEVKLTTPEDKAKYLKEQLEEAKANKIFEIGNACKAAIITGVKVGEEYYSYDSDSATNISNAVTLAAQTGMDVPYHANGKPCRLFTPEEITSIYIMEEQNLTHNTTYHNQLKLYVKSLESIEDVNKVEYGKTQLTGEYLNTYVMIMQQAQKLITKFTGREVSS